MKIVRKELSLSKETKKVWFVSTPFLELASKGFIDPAHSENQSKPFALRACP
jgi:hypothetical protein